MASLPQPVETQEIWSKKIVMMENAFSLNGKTVLVVGGSSGIGNGIARAYLERGATVHVWGTRARADDYAGEAGSNLDGLCYAQVDVSNGDALTRFEPSFRELDILVLAQGAVKYRRQEFEIETFRHVIDVNLNSVMHCSLKFFEMLKRSTGSILIISSIGAYKSVKGNPAYAASKAGLLGLTRTLGDAWGADGVRVNAIAPGMVATKMTAVTTEHPERRKAALDTISLGRFGTPEDMAGVALFLASPLASYITGQTLIVDGGRSL
ncbi:SDR family oxidoreductase [Cupriavidus necator]|uniref:SDR family NAD(P)-dependent oxidoreductase n=1 Tax=Cupriavidus necator TaxID=106590 RepID=UPI003ECCD39B